MTEAQKREAIRRADPEALGGVLAALRCEWPGGWPESPLSILADYVDWETVRYYDEPITAYRQRDERLRVERLPPLDRERSLLS